MNDLAMHILDIVQNSISANATWVEIAILINLMQDVLTIRISDNGKGMPPEMVKRVTDPFVTSRTTRKVGLGLPLLKDSAEQSGGKLGIESTVGKGTVVEATFGWSNIDRPPLGNIANAYVMLATMELILSDHPADCLLCANNAYCDLRQMAAEMGVHQIPFGENLKQSTYEKSTSPSINRDQNKCIMCRRCETMCNEVESVGAIGAINRGFNAVVATAFERPLTESTCVFCGQCVAVCPTGALTEVDNNPDVIKAIADPTKTVIVNTAPSVRAALGEEFGLAPGTLVTGKMAAALRRIGFDYVFDTDFTADMTIMEEGSELVDRIVRYTKGDKSVKLPIFTSCCPAWVNFYECNYPEMLDYPSSAKSPMEMFGSVAKNFYAAKLGIDRKNLVVVSVMNSWKEIGASECEPPLMMFIIGTGRM